MKTNAKPTVRQTPMHRRKLSELKNRELLRKIICPHCGKRIFE